MSDHSLENSWCELLKFVLVQVHSIQPWNPPIPPYFIYFIFFKCWECFVHILRSLWLGATERSARTALTFAVGKLGLSKVWSHLYRYWEGFIKPIHFGIFAKDFYRVDYLWHESNLMTEEIEETHHKHSVLLLGISFGKYSRILNYLNIFALLQRFYIASITYLWHESDLTC